MKRLKIFCLLVVLLSSPGVGIISEHSHTSQDIPEKINKKSLETAGEIAAHVVLNTLKRLKEK